MKQNKFPPGWDEKRVQRVMDYYENQTEDETAAEDEAASQNEFSALIEAFIELGPSACKWILDVLFDSQ